MTVSFPSWSNASFAASREPSASPSGFSWVVSTNRSWPRIASTIASRSLAVVWGELIDQLGHADPALDRRIVLEGQLRSPLHSQFACDTRLENRVRSLKAGERLDALALGTEDRDKDARMTQIRRGLDAGHRDEADPRILQLADRFRKHLPDGFVDATHTVCHQGYSSAWTPSCLPLLPSGAS